MKLYFSDTMNPRKACAAARYLDSPVEFVAVDLGKGEHKRPEFLAINPNGKVPVLTDGDYRLWEANAIMAYLARKAGSDFMPADDARLIEVMRWLSWDADHFTRYAGVLYFEYVIKEMFAIGAPDAAAVEEATGYVRKYAAVLADHLAGRRWLVCSQANPEGHRWKQQRRPESRLFNSSGIKLILPNLRRPLLLPLPSLRQPLLRPSRRQAPVRLLPSRPRDVLFPR